MEKWVVTAKGADFKGIGERFSIDPVTARIIRNRGIVGEKAIQEYLHGGMGDLHSPHSMKDMAKAILILKEKIKEQKKIRVIGDYDIDGIMASFLLSRALNTCGAKVDVAIPDRIADGYGINERLIEQALLDGVDTVLTCDNGIAAGEAIRHGKERGLTIIVTDHHEVPYDSKDDGERNWVLPPADAIVNPKQEDCAYPYKDLCGAAVAYKLAQALYKTMSIANRQEAIESLLPYAAFATIGDVMDLTGENRIIVKEGLKRLRKTDNRGLLALIRVNKLEPRDIKTYHVGFILGPCLNASGRLDTAIRALRLLNAQTQEEALELAQDLLDLNASRKEMTNQGVEVAMEAAKEAIQDGDKVLVLFLPDCHESLAGIIAGRIRERYHRPVFILTKSEAYVDSQESDDLPDSENRIKESLSLIKGSGRSIEAYSMFEEMSKCKELFTKYGGHPMAAGLSLKAENLGTFRKRLNELCSLGPEDFVPKIKIDVPMPIDYISPELIEELSILEPFGKGNEKPVFADRDLVIDEARILGKNRNVCKLRIHKGKTVEMQAIYFGDAERFKKDLNASMSFVYYPEINRFNGRETLQIVIKNYR